jgi:hypothetical protein
MLQSFTNLKEDRKQCLNNGVKIPYQGKIYLPHQRNTIRFFMEGVIEEKMYVGTMLPKGTITLINILFQVALRRKPSKMKLDETHVT